MDWFPYILAAALLIVALLIGRTRPRNSLRARDIRGQVVVGDVSGSVSQTGSPAQEPKPDRVAWAIGIVAALIAAAQFAYDVLGKK